MVSFVLSALLVLAGLTFVVQSHPTPASAATTAMSTVTKSGTDLTNGSTATAGGTAGSANPGDTLKWVVNYTNNQTTPVTPNVTDPITGNQNYVPGSLQVPPSMSGQWSTNGGTSYSTTEPASGVNGVGARGSVVAGTTGASSAFSKPITSLTSSTTGGDGWQVLSYNGNIYLNHHHFFPAENGSTARQIDCYSATTGAECPGYSGGGGNITSTSGSALCSTNGCGNVATGYYNWSYVNPSTGKLYFAASIVGTNSFGIQCFDLTTNTSCGFFLNYTGTVTNAGSAIYVVNSVGLANIGTKLYMLDSNGFIDCFDTSTNAACVPPYTNLFPFSTPNGSQSLGFYGNVQNFGSSTYVWSTDYNDASGTTYVGCLNVVTNTACFAAIDTGKDIQTPLAPVLDATGTVIGACEETNPGTANAWTCWNTSGKVMAQTYPQQASGFVGYNNSVTNGWGGGGVYVSGTKVYMAYNNYASSPGTTTYTCWDWSLNSGAGGPCVGFTNTTSTSLNGGTAIDVRAYTINSVAGFPGCLAEDGDAGIVQFFNAATGGPCATSSASLTSNPNANYCDGLGTHVRGWNNFVIGGITSSQYSGGTYTVYDANGVPVPGFSNVAITNAQQTISLSSIPYSGSTTQLRVAVSLNGVASSATPTLTINYTGDQYQQVCYKTTVPNTCAAAGTTAPNTATAVTTTPSGTTDGPTGNSSGTATFNINAPPSACSLKFVKTANKTLVNPGDVVTYTVSVTNTGTAAWTAANPATFSDNLSNVLTAATYNNNATATTGTVSYAAPTLSWSGALAAGATATITYTVTVKNPNTQSLSNTIVSTNPNTNCPTGSTDPNCTVVLPAATPALTIVKSASPAAGVSKVGDVITYTFVVTNSGNVPLTGVGVADVQAAPAGALTSGPTCVSLASPSGACSGATTPLAVGQSATFTATYTTTLADLNNGSVHDTATATGTAPNGSTTTSPPSSATVPANQAPKLSLVKSVTPTTVSAAGSTVTYSFVVTNTGNVTMSNISVADSGAAGTSFSGTGTLSAINCPTTTLAPAASVTCTATYTVTQSDLDHGSVADTATVTGTPPGTSTPLPPSPPSTVTVPAVQTPTLAMVKTADTKTIDHVGQIVTFNFQVTNTGNVTVSDVHVVDPMPGLSKIDCPTPTLEPGASEICTATYQVTAADLAAGGVTNTATATATPPSTSAPLAPTAPSTVHIPHKAVATNRPASSVSNAPLAFTGTQVAPITTVGLALLATGGLLLALVRRRRRS